MVRALEALRDREKAVTNSRLNRSIEAVLNAIDAVTGAKNVILISHKAGNILSGFREELHILESVDAVHHCDFIVGR